MATSIPVTGRLTGFDYAIRSIVGEAHKVAASGRVVHYLNIGDPVLFGFKTPPHLVEAVERAMRDGHNGYTPAQGSRRHGKRWLRSTPPAGLSSRPTG